MCRPISTMIGTKIKMIITVVDEKLSIKDRICYIGGCTIFSLKFQIKFFNT